MKNSKLLIITVLIILVFVFWASSRQALSVTKCVFSIKLFLANRIKLISVIKLTMIKIILFRMLLVKCKIGYSVHWNLKISDTPVDWQYFMSNTSKGKFSPEGLKKLLLCIEIFESNSEVNLLENKWRKIVLY